MTRQEFDALLGSAIRRRREWEQMSSAELSGLLGRTIPWLSRFERGAYRITVYDLIAVANAMDVTPWDLVSGRMDKAERPEEV